MLIALALSVLLSCNPHTSTEHVAIFSSVEALMRTDTTRTGFFTNTSFFDSTHAYIAYETTRGRITVPNDGTQNFLLCKYDTATLQPIWVAVGGGRGGDGGCNYYTVPTEHAVYVVGCFEDTAYFPHVAGSEPCDTVISRGMADMFIAKYDYDDGTLQWVHSGGSAYSDVIFMVGAERHQETFLMVDSAALTVYANFFGTLSFGDRTLDCKQSGEAVWIRFDKQTGDVLGLGHPISLPMTDQQ